MLFSYQVVWGCMPYHKTYNPKRMEHFTNAFNRREKVPKNVLVCIGPEGDFTEHEMGIFQSIGTPLILSTQRLRTETAGIIAVHGLQCFAEPK